jgi:hypothetical protein
VVVGDEHMMHLRKAATIVAEALLQDSQPHTYVNQQGIGGRCQQIAVTTTATAKGYELQHDFFNFVCKSNKKVADNGIFSVFFS